MNLDEMYGIDLNARGFSQKAGVWIVMVLVVDYIDALTSGIDIRLRKHLHSLPSLTQGYYYDTVFDAL